MGYYTNYELTITSPSGENSMELGDEVKAYLAERDSMKYALLDMQPTKWYAWEKDMTEMSQHFPDVLFVLEGHGEEYGDFWRESFQHGKVIKKEKGVVAFREVK